MARSIVFLTSIPVKEHNVQRFGVDVLRSKGIAVHIIDLSGLLNARVFRSGQDQDSVKEDWVYYINSYPDFENKVKELSAQSIFVDCLVGITGIDFKHEKIFRILKKYRTRYYIISGGDLPTHLVKQGESKKEFLQKFFKRINVGWLRYYFTRLIIRGLIKSGFYSLPVKVFGTGSENVKKYLRKYNDGRIVYVPANSSDYCTYLDYIKQHKEIGQNTEKICVFIDDAQIHCNDCDILKAKKMDGTAYLKAMNNFFRKVEIETGLEVIIASHPSSHYEQYPDAFEGRKIIKWKTIELVAKSSLVIAHSSTAVSYAVLFNKPILFVKTNEMVKIKRDVYILALANELGLVSINVEDQEQMEELSQSIKHSINDNFKKYKYNYLVTPGLEDLTTWEIIGEEILKEPSYGF